MPTEKSSGNLNAFNFKRRIDDFELIPTDKASISKIINEPLPEGVHQFGKIISTKYLLPGDLILTRPYKNNTNSDFKISINIVKSQIEAGFSENHAIWTHAAMYLGDGRNIVESTFGNYGFKHGVRIVPINVFANGEYAIKVRRLPDLTNSQRISLVVGAVRNVGIPYSFPKIFHFWRAAASGAWHQMSPNIRINKSALVCSTLYQEALNYAQNNNGNLYWGRFVTPAELSSSDKFMTRSPKLNWIKIES